jgi:hypothetical protein
MGWLSNWLHAGGTGGLNWHLHAWQSRARWQPTLDAIRAFLHQVPASHSHLLLLGGSAGWMMPSDWLQRFSRIDAYDIDPFAPWLFRQCHGQALDQSGTQVRHHRVDALVHLETILTDHPQACVWFDNMLGQHRYRVRDEVRTERELQALAQRLAGRQWGSLHDLYSGASAYTLDAARFAALAQHPVAADKVDAAYMQTVLQQSKAQGVWNDHCTSGIFPPATPTWLMPWEFRPGYWHWLQAGWVTPPPDRAAITNP